ncbi:hypothetical protein JVU11DRAFT_12235 [Chiua virens]|nr:hypothetical protein JVU11DRAFT_12235 [Chiua virens]
MPPLVDANDRSDAPRIIPPPTGATMPTLQAPHTAPPAAPTYPWGTPYPQPNYTFPSPQDSHARWHQYHGAAAYQQKSAPSPYIPHQPIHPEAQSYDPFALSRRTHSLPNPSPGGARKRSHSIHKHIQWPSGGDLSPLDLPTKMPDVHLFAPRAPDMHTPSSSFSHSTSSSGPSQIPQGMYHERPQQWRHDFKFKSGFASMFRSKPSNARNLDVADIIDSAKLDLHPFVRYSKSRPLTIYDLRREPLTLVFRELDRPPLANDMDHSVTHPHTQYMRLYHPRMPWYIDIRANGAPYISLADFFQQLFAALNKQISKYDFYNNELDEEDRGVLTRAYLERCRHEEERLEGVKRVDFLRGKIEWMGLAPVHVHAMYYNFPTSLVRNALFLELEEFGYYHQVCLPPRKP